ncbi:MULTISPECIES: DUF3604 domain-containing protein [Roseobacteraceae]|uniref:DUF3604 domain-containing protein n=1 Tax=Pseudosulfitobacter pseudonitzschiae TaxID=1402135 RepID=A0A221K864_9RHOB|nr:MULTISPECIES: DUF3604 domain-containing protein [Roseobacteraceae]ASM75155.1 hypothetical protein SULPSESMR1_04434 [Pseudosulfitobacter pseudonitzschiae]
MTIKRNVDPEMIGESRLQTVPGTDPALFGTAVMDGPSHVEVRSYQSFKITYTTGKLGLDDTGAIRVAFRLISDAGALQTSDPTAANYVTARSSGDGQLMLKYDRNGGQRPWNETLTIYQRGGYLNPGETIEITLGDTSQGSPGMLMSTFYEGARVFRVLADVQATGNFIPLPDTRLELTVGAGPLHRYRAVLPTRRRPGEPFVLGLKAEDLWGNPTDQGPIRFTVESTLAVEGLPELIDFSPESGALRLEGLSVRETGLLTLKLTSDQGHVVEAGPLQIREGIAHYWGDLHGQTGETVGTNSIEHYFDFARNKSFLDVTSHQANDFQIKPAFWEKLNQLTAQVNEPGIFTVLPGYEWSGNTAVGGDHNVFFRDEGASIYRCSHALVAEHDDLDADAHTLTDLYEKLHAEPVDSVMYAHVGGRYANIFFDHDPTLEAAVEVHSAWGSFEWVLTDGFPIRRRVGVVANSDGHKGRPGASYPGASFFGAYGGLTCFLMEENTRDTVFEAIRRRHTYGTSGPRVAIDIEATLPEGGTLYHRNPIAQPDGTTEEVTRCTMGDIVRSNGASARVSVAVEAPCGIESIELRSATDVVTLWRGFGDKDLGSRLRLMWSGAEYRGRGRNTRWQGRAQVAGGKIAEFAPVNRLNPEQPLQQVGSNSVIFNTITTGNRMGCDLWLKGETPTLTVETNHGTLSLDPTSMGVSPVVMEAGGLARRLVAQRLPDAPLQRSAGFDAEVEIAATGDTPVWLCVNLEDGNQAWTSPIYLHRD